VTGAVSVPALKQDIEINTSDLDKAIAAAKRFQAAMDRALDIKDGKFKAGARSISTTLKELTAEADRAGKRMEALGRNVDGVSTKLKAAATAATPFRRSIRDLATDADKAETKLDKLGRAVSGLSTKARTAGASFGPLGTRIDRLGNQADRSTNQIKALDRAIERLGKSANLTTVEILALGAAIRAMSDAAKDSKAHLKDMGDSAKAASKQAKDSRADIRGLRDDIDDLGDSSKRTTGHVDDLTNSLNRNARSSQNAHNAYRAFAGALGDGNREGGRSSGILGGLVRLIGGIATSSLGAFTSVLQLSTVLGGMGGLVGVLGAAVSSLVLAATGLGGALAPIVGLAGLLPSLAAGLGAVAITAKLAFKDNEAPEFVASLDRLKNTYKNLAKAIQGETNPAVVRFFDSLSELYPIVEKSFKATAQGLASVIDQTREFVSGSGFQNDFAALMESAGRVTTQYGGAILGVIKGITNMSVAGIPVAEKFASKMRELGERFQNYTQQSRDNGAMAAMFERGWVMGGRLVDIIKDIGYGFRDITRVGSTVGLPDKIFDSFARGAQGIRDFANTYKDQLTNASKVTGVNFEALGRLVSQLGRTLTLDFGQIDISPLIDGLGDVVGMVGKLVGPLTSGTQTGIVALIDGLKRSMPSLVGIADTIGGIITEIGELGGDLLPKVMGPLSQLLISAHDFARNFADAIRTVVPAVTGPLDDVIRSTERMLSNLVTALEPFVTILVGPIAEALELVQDEIGSTAVSISGPLQSTVKAVLPAIQQAFRDVVPALGELIVSLAGLASAFGDTFGGAISTATAIIVPLIDGLAGLAREAAALPAPIKDLIGVLGALILLGKVSLFTGMFAGVAGLIARAVSSFRGLGTNIGTLAGQIRNAFSGSFGGSFLGRLGAIGGAVGSFIGGVGKSLVAFLGGPWGLAFIAAGIALSIFMGKQREAAQKAAEAKQKFDELKGSLDKITGAATKDTQSTLIKQLTEEGVAQKLGTLNTSLGEYVSAVSKGGDAVAKYKDKVKSSFKEIISSTDGVDVVQQQFFAKNGINIDDAIEAWSRGGEGYKQFVDEIAARTGVSASVIDDQFNRITGSIDAVTNGAASAFRGLGTSMGQFNSASALTRDEFRGISDAAAVSAKEVAGFGTATSSQLYEALLKSYDAGIPVIDALREIGITGSAATTIIGSLGDSVDSASGVMVNFGNSTQKAYEAFLNITKIDNIKIEGAAELGESFATIASNASTAADKAGALKNILDILNGKTLDATAATSSWYSALDSVDEALDKNVEGNAAFVQQINDSNGVLDLTDKKHRDFAQALAGVRDGYTNTLSATYETTKAQQGSEAALKGVYQAAIQQRDEFVKGRMEAGLLEGAANALADQLGLIPKDVRLAFATDGTSELVQQQIAGVVASIDGIPNGTVTIDGGPEVDTLTERLRNLGYEVSEPKDGKVTITSNGPEVQAEVDRLKAAVDGTMEGEIAIDTNDITNNAVPLLDDLGYSIESLPGGRILITNDVKKTQLEVDGLVTQVNAIDDSPGKVVIDSKTTTNEAITRLRETGYTVKTLPDGRVIITDNTAETKTHLNDVTSTLGRVPPGKSITVNALTEEAKRILNDLGYKVQTFPNGKTTITATAATSTAENALNNTARNRTSVITVKTVGGTQVYTTASGAKAEAEGGLVVPMAHGGIMKTRYGNVDTGEMMRRARPMSGQFAQIVPRNTPRLIGDNLRHEELFVPLDRGSAQSHALMSRGAEKMGYGLVPMDKLMQQMGKAASNFSGQNRNGVRFNAEGSLSGSSRVLNDQIRRFTGRIATQSFGLAQTSAGETDQSRVLAAVQAQMSQSGQAVARIGAMVASNSQVTANATQAMAAALKGKTGQVNLTIVNPRVKDLSQDTNTAMQLLAASGLLN
jgi:ABC-type transporter Mla subunit MlaD